MSWLNDLYQTYKENEDQVGKVQRTSSGKEIVLLPIAHAYQNAQIEVTITTEGEFYEADVVPKEEAQTMIPVTIESAGRSGSTSAPHLIHDNLVYVAGDFEKYGGVYKKNKAGKNSYQMYIENLLAWCESEYSQPVVKSVLQYLEKGTLIEDLVKENVMFEKNHQLIPKWSKELEAELGEKPPLFSVVVGEQSTSFVRFAVQEKGKEKRSLWGDKEIIDSFVAYYTNELTNEGLDYVTGEMLPLTENHPSKVRYGGDMAKLISGNDSTNFTYKGRFTDKNQVASISYEVSQKGHNALKWLIGKQAFILDGRVFLTWGKKETEVPNPEESSADFLDFDAVFAQDEEAEMLLNPDTTHQQFSELFKQALNGYSVKLSYHEPIYIMILDAATPGRMGVLYYRSFEKEQYFTRIDAWHQTCFWRHTYGSKKKQRYTFWGAPSLRDMAEAAYGARASDTLIKNTIHELFPCVVDGKKMPINLVRSLLQRASNPVSMEKWEWEKTLSIACAVMKKHFDFKKEEKSVALDKNETDRNYLFGRMLAVADVLEERALYKAGINRSTNAIRYMNAFSNHPLKTWKIIQENLIPYQARLRGKGTYYQKLLDEIGASFELEHYTDKALDGKYLLGYYSQRAELKKKIEEKTEE
ncbi:type I-C CRISPR-associated protein Cas8c/Csd1 [Enterococcus caccae]|uniref:CRISPR-associated protein cas8c/csd1, subtype I-c/dvulg n=1 Tax=Enterococcus caccae ATCC BAA-1240 TaxID=1158612 RepID=R3U9G5_9ENTE|nr:type I-C CRISPR-associated protein Cas8c/Csd1 [Enterococcus caccae]EOL50113.1 CRISPR-associated protein cas8c/csd1, subtype I-c/dvulg [Enterococcus caccae ATCC BAA-1240]EOT56207.1 CRISPR-associated protein cas8c/csd1, subtype I-c/dvulg [Enterococcus caccae ATCC BAA-1240]OJG25485.1 CRISPR-associated protein cas8c/csd1, subtype I-c/dvulg [Enterococcus caccae]